MSERELDNPSEYQNCENCGAPVHTVPGMDTATVLTEYTTTTSDREYYCDRDCLAESVSKGADHYRELPGGGTLSFEIDADSEVRRELKVMIDSAVKTLRQIGERGYFND